MRYNILIGGKAGQGINKVSEIISRVLVKYGYFTFNYRDYPSLIRGGHNFNILSVSDIRIGSSESKLDAIIAMDQNTIDIHKDELKKDGVIIGFEEFKDLGRNLNVAQAGALIKVLGVPKEDLINEIKIQLNFPESIDAANKGYDSEESKFHLKRLKNKVTIMNGNKGVSIGAVNSGIDVYVAYPMTPATGVMHELADMQKNNHHMVFEAENEIAVVNAALGASFAGAKTMIGSSGGGYDLMGEGLSLQGMSEVPLVVYLASRPGPASGIPTYSTQADLDIALRAGHGEFPRTVAAPGSPNEAIDLTNQAFYIAEKLGCLSIILSDKHIAESEFSSDGKPDKPIKIKIKRKTPGEGIVKASSYEHDKQGHTTEDMDIAQKNADAKIAKYETVKNEVKKFDMIKMHGNMKSKNLVIGWGSTKGVILDAIEGQDFKFLQVLYLKPMSDEIKKEMEKAKNIILVEQNLTGQLGRLIREKTGIKIEKRILKYNSRPFTSDELQEELLKKIK